MVLLSVSTFYRSCQKAKWIELVYNSKVLYYKRIWHLQNWTLVSSTELSRSLCLCHCMEHCKCCQLSLYLPFPSLFFSFPSFFFIPFPFLAFRLLWVFFIFYSVAFPHLCTLFSTITTYTCDVSQVRIYTYSQIRRSFKLSNINGFIIYCTSTSLSPYCHSAHENALSKTAICHLSPKRWTDDTKTGKVI